MRSTRAGLGSEQPGAATPATPDDTHSPADRRERVMAALRGFYVRAQGRAADTAERGQRLRRQR
jgi:hypothetical protein